MNKIKLLLFHFILIAILFSNQLIYSQTTASINGIVVDSKGDPLPGANVVAVHNPSGTKYGTSSRNDGRYNLNGLRVGGPYTITVSFIGCKTQIQEGENLLLDQNLRIDFKLPDQAVELTGVTVTAEKDAILSQSRTGAAQNVSTKQMEEIPTINRSFTSFAKLSPLFSGTSLQAAGRTSRFNNIQIDGAQYNDLFGLGSSGTPGGVAGTNPISLDAIKEFQVVVAPFDVRYSGFTGGGINAISRSGNNELSGSIFYFGRNDNLVGKTNPITGAEQAYPSFSNYQTGFRLGGSILKDKLFFFVNGEITANTKPLLNSALSSGYGGDTPAQIQALADQFASILKSKGLNAGSYNSFNVQQPSSKLFLKFDYNLTDNTQVTLSDNYVNAYQDNLAGRTSSNALSFDSFNYRMKSITNAINLQANTHFGNDMSNNLILGYTTVRDHRNNTGDETPEIIVKELNRTFTMTAGYDQYSGANQLDQNIFEFTDNFSYYYKNHTFTVGTHNEFFSFRNLYIRDYLGYYQYNSLADFQNDLPATYYHDYSRTSNPNPAANFDVAQFGFYLQDEWVVVPSVKITYGIRVDIPTFANPPAQNDSVAKYFPGFKTNQIPSGNLLWSPRVGFNWDVLGDRTTQIRGGVGIFTGRVPYVWLSNEYGNTGTMTAEVSNTSGKTLPFVADPYNQYISGDPRITNGALGTPNVKSEIDLADPNLKMPQLLRYNVGVDQQLPFGFIGTVDFLYSKTINDMIYRRLNLKPIVGYVNLPTGGQEGNVARAIYGGTDGKNNNFNDVLEIYNTSDGYQYNLVFQIQRNIARGISVNAGYNYGRAYDRNSVTSSQAQSQMRYLAIDADPNNPSLSTSDWEIRHRVYASVAYSWEFFKDAPTTITLFYNGQSGRPFSFVAQGSQTTGSASPNDLNGDNYDMNDLFYIPKDASEILLGSISSGKFVPATAAGTTYNDLNAFINNNSYLSSHRGQMSQRNGAAAPWSYYLDLHFTQTVPDLWGLGAFMVYLDMSNVLNMINHNWGVVNDVSSDTYAIVSYKGRITYNGIPNVPVYSFSAPTNNTPFTAQDPSSRWAMQLGIRYSF